MKRAHVSWAGLACLVFSLSTLAGCDKQEAPSPSPAAPPVADVAPPVVLPQAPAPAIEVHGLTLSTDDSAHWRAKVTRHTPDSRGAEFFAVGRCQVGAHIIRSTWEASSTSAAEVGSLAVGETMRIVFEGAHAVPQDASRCEIKVMQRAEQDAPEQLNSNFCWHKTAQEASMSAGGCTPAVAHSNPWTDSESLQVALHKFTRTQDKRYLAGFVNANVDVAALPQSSVGHRPVGFVVRASCQLGHTRWVEYKQVKVPTADRYMPGESLGFRVRLFEDTAEDEVATECRFETVVPGRTTDATFCQGDAGSDLGPCAAASAVRPAASAKPAEVGGLSVTYGRGPSNGKGRLWVRTDVATVGSQNVESLVRCGAKDRTTVPDPAPEGIGTDTHFDQGETRWIYFLTNGEEVKSEQPCELVVKIGEDEVGMFCFNNAGSVEGSCVGATLPPPVVTRPRMKRGGYRRGARCHQMYAVCVHGLPCICG